MSAASADRSPAPATPSPAGDRAIVVATVIDATPAEVWADVRDIGSHVTWMQDAEAIRFVSEQREGPGTRFECDTRIGPLALTDVMEITAWEDERRMGVRHVGLVEGTGEFTLAPVGTDRPHRVPVGRGPPLPVVAGRARRCPGGPPPSSGWSGSATCDG